MPDAPLGCFSLAECFALKVYYLPHRAIEWSSPAGPCDRAWLTQLELRVGTGEYQDVEMSGLALYKQRSS